MNRLRIIRLALSFTGKSNADPERMEKTDAIPENSVGLAVQGDPWNLTHHLYPRLC